MILFVKNINTLLKKSKFCSIIVPKLDKRKIFIMSNSYFIFTYGCQMNVHETEKLAGILEERGYAKAEKVEDANLIVFNTCCIRESAEQKIIGNIGAIKPLKKQNKDLIVAVCGCMTQQQDMASNLRKKFPFIDIVFGANNIEFFGEYLDEFLKQRKYINQVIADKNYTENTTKVNMIRDNKLYAYVNIMYGCNNYCTYCIVPYVRGRESSRAPQKIYEEVRNLIAMGYKVITLLGQNVNSYGLDGTTSGVTFAKLLDTIAQFDGDFELRFMTSHPKDLSDEVIEVMAKNPKISKSLHLPVQAGSDKILKAMNRTYDTAHYRELITKIRKAMPQITLSTDIIVGFPGETEEEYQATVDLVKEVEYHNAFVFMYSKRRGTIAEKMDNQVPLEIKRKRIMNLLDVQHAISADLFERMIGTTQRVLVEDENNMYYMAKAQCGKVVKILKSENPNVKIGQFYDVKISNYKGGNLYGGVL